MTLVIVMIGILSGILGAGAAYEIGMALWLVLAAFVLWGNIGSGAAIAVALITASDDGPAAPQLSRHRRAQQAR